MKFQQQISSALPGLVKYKSCDTDLPHPAEFVFEYFDKAGTLTCGHCGTEIDVWNAVLRVLEFEFPLLGGQAYTFLGAKVTLIPIELTANQTRQVNFLELGVPKKSHIVCINYTPEGEVFPLEVHGNQPTRGEHPRQVTLFGRPTVKKSGATAKINISVTWVPEVSNFAPWKSLTEAIDAFAQKKYARIIIPANVFVETLTRSVLSKLMLKELSKKRVDDFLSNAASYKYQVNVLLPIFATFLELRPMPDKIRETLNRLRKLRNSLAHSGEKEIDITKHGAAELLCGALLGSSYCLYVHSQLDDRKSGQ